MTPTLLAVALVALTTVALAALAVAFAFLRPGDRDEAVSPLRHDERCGPQQHNCSGAQRDTTNTTILLNSNLCSLLG